MQQFVKVDLDDLNQLTSLSALTDIDLLINNAGISGNIHSDKGHLDMEKSAFDYSTTDLEETIKTNFLGTHAVIKELLPTRFITGSDQDFIAAMTKVLSKCKTNSFIFASDKCFHDFSPLSFSCRL